jgi:YD repeat-containing protein
MKRNLFLLITAGAFVTGCQKADQQISEDSVKANYLKSAYLEHKPNAEITACRIVQINYTTNGLSDALQFTYNAVGDPVSVTRLNGAGTGRPNFAFKYNDKNQLTDFIGPYNSGNAFGEFWHKYFYDNKGNVVQDSTYIFPKISNGYPENAYSSHLTYYIYDANGRMVKDSTPALNSVHTFSYDENGNKVGKSYDNNLSVYRTSAVWMFLNKDYSVNNSLTTSSVNDKSLPLSYTSSDGSGFSFLYNDYSNVQFSYDCSGKRP